MQREVTEYAKLRFEKKKPRVLVGFRIPPEQKELLRQLAFQKQVSASSYLCSIWENHLQTIGKTEDMEMTEDES